MPGQARQWMITLNNFTEEEREALEALESQVEELVLDQEEGEEEHTPHLHAYVHWRKPLRQA